MTPPTLLQNSHQQSVDSHLSGASAPLVAIICPPDNWSNPGFVQKLEDTSYLCKKNTLWLDFCFKWTGQIHDIIDLEIFGGHLISSNKKKHKISANRLRLGPCGDFDLEPPALISTPSWWVFPAAQGMQKNGDHPRFRMRTTRCNELWFLLPL